MSRIVVVSQTWEGPRLDDWGKPEPQDGARSVDDWDIAEAGMFVLWQKRMAELQMGQHALPWLERFAIATILEDGSHEVHETGPILTIGRR